MISAHRSYNYHNDHNYHDNKSLGASSALVAYSSTELLSLTVTWETRSAVRIHHVYK